MQPDDRDTPFLWDMRGYASQVASLMQEATFDQFTPRSALRLAVERAVEIIGEAANRVSLAFRLDHPEITWHEIIGMRNVLAHEYGNIDPQVLWDVATIDVHDLIAAIDRIVPPRPDNSQPSSGA